MRYQSRKWKEDLGSIRPINQGHSAQDSFDKRDLNKADANPMQIDTSIDWSHVGGLSEHVRALKEMVMFPLLYPEYFDRFNITPPR